MVPKGHKRWFFQQLKASGALIWHGREGLALLFEFNITSFSPNFRHNPTDHVRQILAAPELNVQSPLVAKLALHDLEQTIDVFSRRARSEM